MTPHSKITLTPSAQALVEAFVVEAQGMLSDEKLNEALRRMIANSMHEFEHLMDSPDFDERTPFKSKANAVKLKSIWRLAVEKLLSATVFQPDPDVVSMVGLRMEDVEHLRNPRVEDGDISEPEALNDYATSPPTSEDLRDGVHWLGADTHLTSQPPPEPEPPTTKGVVEEQEAHIKIEVEEEVYRD